MAKGYKTGGRQKGTPNKATASIRQALEPIVEEEIERLSDLLDQLDPKDRALLITKLLPYVAPKLQSIEITEPEEPGKDISNMTGDQVAEYIHRLTGISDKDLEKHFHRPLDMTKELYLEMFGDPKREEYL